jgi:hypothetical protein
MSGCPACQAEKMIFSDYSDRVLMAAENYCGRRFYSVLIVLLLQDMSPKRQRGNDLPSLALFEVAPFCSGFLRSPQLLGCHGLVPWGLTLASTQNACFAC